MDDRLDIPYFPSQPESELDKKFRLYNEADELYEKFIKDISESNLDNLTKIICLYNIKTQWLERVLNDFYDRIAITSSQPNPLVIGDKISNKRARSFKKNGITQGFADLTLGGKLKALEIFHYKDVTDEKKYLDYLKELSNFIKERNEVIHNLFTQMIETKEKAANIAESVIRLEVLLIATKQREEKLSIYLFDHMGEYWDLTIDHNNKKE